MGSEERELEELLRIKRRRLNALEKQAARMGINAPAELVNERDDLRAELEKDKKTIEPIVKGELSDETLAALRAYGVPASVTNALMLVETAIDGVKDVVRDHQVELHDIRDKVITLNVDVRELKRDNEEGKQGRQRNFWLFMLVIVLLIVIGVVVAPTAAREFGWVQ